MHYSNKRKAAIGDSVIGKDAAGKEIAGLVVVTYPPLIGVSHQGRLVGDLDPKNFIHVEDLEKLPAPPGK